MSHSTPGSEGTGGSFRCFCLLLSLLTKVGRSGENNNDADPYTYLRRAALRRRGQAVKLVGWMENVREVGGNLAFVVLRDFYGTTQIVVETKR